MMDIVTRAEWGARPPRYIHYMETPSAELWLHHSAGALDAAGNGVWWDDVRGIQNYHMDAKGWSDIAYSFLIGGGQIFEGRGAGIVGGHTLNHNSISHGICLIGNYEFMIPKQQDLEAIAWLMKHGRENGWWGELTGDHRQASGGTTQCCGVNLRQTIPMLREMANATPPPAPPKKENEMHPVIVAAEAGITLPDGTPDSRVFITDGATVTHLKNWDIVNWYKFIISNAGGNGDLQRANAAVWDGLVWQHEQSVGRAAGNVTADVDEAALAAALAPLLEGGATAQEIAQAVIAEIAS